MATVLIDGKKLDVAEGTNLVEAAKQVGVEIPTYCYHPGLTVVGQCRICFVEVEGAPRLVTACSTPVRDGMVVHTDNQKVREARAAVMEFLLANHPLDCPVCDQAGECYLQDYSVEHGLDTTHMVDERRTFPGLERRMIGPHVVQNQNRCIHCTRCVRFTQEIAETHDLTLKSRGNHAFIDTADGKPLTNPWSACVADVCPVGALTVKEFRFRARVWHLDTAESVCPGCSIGCAVTVSHLKGVVHRFLPRFNPEVNAWWMCDYGRFLAEGLNARDVDRPARRSGSTHEPTTWRDAVAALKALVEKSPQVVLSAGLSNEALYLAKKVLVDRCGLEAVVPVHGGKPRRVKNARREWVDSRDAHPNALGARLIGLDLVQEEGLAPFLAGSTRPVLLLDNRAHPWLEGAAAAKALSGRGVAVLARTHTPLSRQAALQLPVASWAETEGSYTSSTGRVQLARRAFVPRGQARPAWEVLFALGVALGVEEERTVSPRTLFDELAAEIPAFAGMSHRRLASEGGIPTREEVPDVG